MTERDAAREAAEKIDSYLRNVQGHSVDGVADFIRQETRELREALEQAQSDINWMLNNRQFLNPEALGYIEAALAKHRSV